MPEEKKLSSAQQQQKIRPKIDDIIPVCVISDKQQTVSDFVEYMRVNKMSPVWSGVYNTWKFNYKGNIICKILLPDPKNHAAGRHTDYAWVVTLNLDHLSEYEESIISQGWQNIFWNNILYCVRSKKSPSYNAMNSCIETVKQCAGGKTITMLGRELNNICYSCPITEFRGPDEMTVEIIKKLMEWERKARTDAIGMLK
jgi:hypothetical protein